MKTRRLFSVFSLVVLLASNSFSKTIPTSAISSTTSPDPFNTAAAPQPCPQIGILTGLIQPIICVTKFPKATFDVFIPDPPNSGIQTGTVWTIDWGDGTAPATYISTSANNVPPLAWRQHTYS